MTEMLDIVNLDDIVIDNMAKSTIYQKKGVLFRVINAFIINPKNELWIPTRHPKKQLFPNCLDCSIGGHVKSGENYFQAFCREAIEETNINPLNHPHKLLTTLSPLHHKTSAFMHVYAIYTDCLIDYNNEDFIDFEWLSPKSLRKKLGLGVPAKSDLPIILEECFKDA